MLQFENYHCHTSYSNALTQPDSTLFIKDYAKVYRERGHSVLCMSEHGNRSNVWEQFDICEAYKAEKDAKGNPQIPYVMTPLAAAECYFVPDRFAEINGKRDNRNFHLVLVAKDQEGFYQLNEALSEANLTGFYFRARVDLDILSKLDYHHFLCTTACCAGITKDENYEHLACQLHEIFRENFYLEVQHHPQKIQVETNTKILRLYQKYHWPLIYGTDSHYIHKEDKILRTELLLSKGIKYGDEDSFDLFLPTPEEAFQLLWDQGVLVKARIEEAMENTLILREFEGVRFTKEKKIPNSDPTLTQEQRNFKYKKLCCDEYIRKAGMPTKEEAAELHAEMDAVADTNTSDYFLLCKKIVDLGKEKGGVITTTGRGSGSSFATNFALGFTSLNRLHSPVKLYPERFISKERMAAGILPDLDINLTNVEAFEEAGKEILGEYGCQPMIQYGTTKTLSAFKLLAKARNIDFTTANEVSKQINAYENDVKHALENNADDPDYNVDNDVQIESYVEEQYLPLIEQSKQYQKIVLSIGPHPCAHLLLDRDIRREIGLVHVKDGRCIAYIDGGTADAYGYLKLDLLRVIVVDIISKTFQKIGRPVMTVDELLEAVKNDKAVWDLYAKGYTQGLNQCEQPKSTERVMQYKPKNIVEQSLFVAAIRPGFKSMIDTFISRKPFSYNIKSLDDLLKTKEIPDSFLAYDEQVLSILISAGIPAADAYVCLKAIKKKKLDKVESFKDRFKEGFTKHLKNDEHASSEEAQKIVENIWGIILSSASYLFNASHSLCMSCDSLYVAWLKAHHPYELYVTMLEIFAEKKNLDKISNIISEMKRYKGISLIPGRFGEDNRDWSVNKENATISQSLSAIKYMSREAAEDLYQLGIQKEAEMGVEYYPATLHEEPRKRVNVIRRELKKCHEIYDTPEDPLMSEEELIDLRNSKARAVEEGVKLEAELSQILNNPDSVKDPAREVHIKAPLDCFVNVIRAIQMNTKINVRIVRILIMINYFSKFGKSGKLLKVFDEFYEGKNSLAKGIKGFNKRLEVLREFEASLPDEDLPIGLRLQEEFDNIGLCLSVDPGAPPNLYFVESVDDKYSIKAKLYSVQRGTTGIIRITKKQQEKNPLQEGLCIRINEFNMRPKCTYRNGQRTPVPGEKDCWVTNYTIVYREKPSAA